MSESVKSACQAIMEQKDAKGTQCWRPSKENGFCGIHQKQAHLQTASSQGFVKCSTYRCIELINPSESKYCKSCMAKKQEVRANTQLCQATIDQGPTKGSPCVRKANESGFCGKHAPRQLFIKEASKQNKRVCDDGKRACKNFTKDNKLLCEECLEKCRVYDNQQYSVRKESGSCLDCGQTLSIQLSGLRDKQIQRCEACYLKMRNVEINRTREERNYKSERKKNVDPHYKLYRKGANVRNLWFDLSIEQFTSLVNSACFYCDTYNENEVIGIDRVNSELGYCIENCVPCCELCNFMKNDMNVEEFLAHISKIAKNIVAVHAKLGQIKMEDSVTISLKDSHKSYIRPSKIVDMYMKQELGEYIQACEKENRNRQFIDDLQKVISQKMKRKEFNDYLKQILNNCS